MHVSRLRKRIEPLGLEITSIRGFGYRLHAAHARAQATGTAPSSAVDVNRILLDILVVLLAAKVAAELADRVNVPAVVGEIVAGVIIGPSVLGWVHSSEALQTLAQLGVILLLLEVGLEMDLAELGSVGTRRAPRRVRRASSCRWSTGAGAGLALGMSGKEALFVGAALTATSVGITARVFGDLRALATVEAKTVLGAAVADDILGLVILTVVTRIVTEGSVSVARHRVGRRASRSASSCSTTLIGVRIVPPVVRVGAALQPFAGNARRDRARVHARRLRARARRAARADRRRVRRRHRARAAAPRPAASGRELAPVAHLLVPVFFLQIGIDADVGQFARPAVFGMAAVLLVIAVARQARARSSD